MRIKIEKGFILSVIIFLLITSKFIKSDNQYAMENNLFSHIHLYANENNNDSIRIPFKKSLYFSISGVYHDVSSVLDMNTLWLPFGYSYFNKKNAGDIMIGYALPLPFGNEYSYFSNDTKTIFGLKLKYEYKYFIFSNKNYVGLAMFYLYTNTLKIEDVVINKIHLKKENINYIRHKFILVPKIGVIVCNTKKLYADLSVGTSLNYHFFCIKNNVYPKEYYSDYKNMMNKSNVPYVLFYIEINVGLKM